MWVLKKDWIYRNFIFFFHESKTENRIILYKTVKYLYLNYDREFCPPLVSGEPWSRVLELYLSWSWSRILELYLSWSWWRVLELTILIMIKGPGNNYLDHDQGSGTISILIMIKGPGTITILIMIKGSGTNYLNHDQGSWN